jgi:hypothetical protein
VPSQTFKLDGDAAKYLQGRKSMKFTARNVANGVQLGCPEICLTPTLGGLGSTSCGCGLGVPRYWAITNLDQITPTAVVGSGDRFSQLAQEVYPDLTLPGTFNVEVNGFVLNAFPAYAGPKLFLDLGTGCSRTEVWHDPVYMSSGQTYVGPGAAPHFWPSSATYGVGYLFEQLGPQKAPFEDLPPDTTSLFPGATFTPSASTILMSTSIALTPDTGGVAVSMTIVFGATLGYFNRRRRLDGTYTSPAGILADIAHSETGPSTVTVTLSFVIACGTFTMSAISSSITGGSFGADAVGVTPIFGA